YVGIDCCLVHHRQAVEPDDSCPLNGVVYVGQGQASGCLVDDGIAAAAQIGHGHRAPALQHQVGAVDQQGRIRAAARVQLEIIVVVDRTQDVGGAAHTVGIGAVNRDCACACAPIQSGRVAVRGPKEAAVVVQRAALDSGIANQLHRAARVGRDVGSGVIDRDTVD